MWVVTITRKPKEFRSIFLSSKQVFFTTNGSASFSDIARIGNHQRHLYFVRHISSRATSRFKFERDWRYLFIQIKMTKERRCSLHWLRGCSTRVYHSIPKNSSKKIRYLRQYLNTNSQSTSWHTQLPTSSKPFSLGSRPRTCLGTKIQISPVEKITFPWFLTKTTLLMIIS